MGDGPFHQVDAVRILRAHRCGGGGDGVLVCHGVARAQQQLLVDRVGEVGRPGELVQTGHDAGGLLNHGEVDRQAAIVVGGQCESGGLWWEQRESQFLGVGEPSGPHQQHEQPAVVAQVEPGGFEERLGLGGGDVVKGDDDEVAAVRIPDRTGGGERVGVGVRLADL